MSCYGRLQFSPIPFPADTCYIYAIFREDRGWKGWQLFHVRYVRRFVISVRLEVKWSISYGAIYTFVLCFDDLVGQQKLLKIFVKSYSQNHIEGTERSYNLK